MHKYHFSCFSCFMCQLQRKSKVRGISRACTSARYPVIATDCSVSYIKEEAVSSCFTIPYAGPALPPPLYMVYLPCSLSPTVLLKISYNLQLTLECTFNCCFHISPNYHIIFSAASPEHFKAPRSLSQFSNHSPSHPTVSVNVLILCDRRRINHKNQLHRERRKGGGRGWGHTWSTFTIDKYQKFHIRKSKKENIFPSTTLPSGWQLN